MNCMDCIGYERNYGKQTVKCAKGVFDETPLAKATFILRRKCRYFESFRQAVNRITTEHERRRRAA